MSNVMIPEIEGVGDTLIFATQQATGERPGQHLQQIIFCLGSLHLRGFLFFQRGVDCGVGADFVVGAVGPALD